MKPTQDQAARLAHVAAVLKAQEAKLVEALDACDPVGEEFEIDVARDLVEEVRATLAALRCELV